MANASYNITNDRLFYRPNSRLSAEEYDKAKAARFQWWPGRKVFSAVWNTDAEDLIWAAGCEITEDDTPDDLEGRVDRFQTYADNASRDAAAASDALTGIDPAASYKHAPSAKRTAQLATRAVKSTEEATYWQERIAGAIRNAQHKDNPGTIARRIQGLEADLRKWQRTGDEEKLRNAQGWYFSDWRTQRGLPYDFRPGDGTPEQKADFQTWGRVRYDASIAHAQRWIDHITMRLDYERAYLAAVGGLPADGMAFEVGGLVRWRGWGIIVKVNKTTLTVSQRWFEGKVSKTEIKAVKTAAEVKAMTPQELRNILADDRIV